MLTCGIKLTHDGSVSLFNDKKLIFCVEIEKLNNNKRYSNIKDLSLIEDILGSFGYKINEVDQWIIDGWDGIKNCVLEVLNYKIPSRITVAPYHEGNNSVSSLTKDKVQGYTYIGRQKIEYTSYTHVLGHIFSAYSTSPFLKKKEDSAVLVWDGGMFARIYYINAKNFKIYSFGPCVNIIGHFYATAGHYFGPFKKNYKSKIADDLSVAGKIMAYIALGEKNTKILHIIRKLYDTSFEKNDFSKKYFKEIGGWGTSVEASMDSLHTFFDKLRDSIVHLNCKEEDVLSSIHYFIQELLVEKVVNLLSKHISTKQVNLCIAGGCGLNIKWNSAFRDNNYFKNVWIPPFPNDSGSSIGAVATYLFFKKKVFSIDWSVFLGPIIKQPTKVEKGWYRSYKSAKDIAKILYESGEPILFLNSRAELGPRALGNRSIIAPATEKKTKDLLNKIKKREFYRPVAPICLEEHAKDIFTPGFRDPYMLFDHHVKKSWKDKIPAVIHLDNTARLQTVTSEDNKLLAEILYEYNELSGIPVLCNTSANFNGSGFFPDIESAMNWGQVNKIWCDGILYEKK